MLSERSPQKLHERGKRVVGFGNYHCGRYSSNFKRTKIDADITVGNICESDVEISRNSRVVRARTSRIAELNDSKSEHMLHGKAKELGQKWGDKRMKVVENNQICEVPKRKPSLERRWKLKDEDDERANKQMNGDRRVSLKSSLQEHSRSKKYPPTPESSVSVLCELNVDLPRPPNYSLVPFDEYQEVASRNRVLKRLKKFKEEYSRLKTEREMKPKSERRGSNRADLKAADSLKDSGEWINCYPYIGSVPGVHIGDCFQYRSELVIIGLHREYVCGIHFEEFNGQTIATSIVDSGRYYNNQEINADLFYYMGEGGNPEVSNGLKDQTLDGGNLALVNSMVEDLPVRVIRGRHNLVRLSTMGVNSGNGFAFVYEGLYKVSSWKYMRDHKSGKKMFRFKMTRVTHDPNLTQRLSYKPRKSAIGRKHHQEKTLIRPDDNHKDQEEEKTHISQGKDVKFTYDSKPNGYGCKMGASSSRHAFSLKNKDENFDFEAAACLAKPVVSTRPQYAKRSMLKMN